MNPEDPELGTPSWKGEHQAENRGLSEHLHPNGDNARTIY